MAALQKLLGNQATSAIIFEKSFNNYNNTNVEKRTKGLISERLTALSEIWSDYKKDHYTIIQATQALEDSELQKYDYFANDQFSKVENKYFTFRGILRDALDAFETKVEPSPKSEHETSSSLRLPSITIPKFSGSYDSWRPFHDLFNSLVHTNSALSSVQKLHYLKSSVSGEAEHLLRQFPMTNSSYDSAWKTLLERYDNKRVLVNAQLKALFNLPKAAHESAKAIKTLLDKSSECIFELEALQVSTKQWDAILIYMVVQCLPAETHRAWEQEVNTAKGLPTYESLKIFLQSRFRILEAIVDTKPSLANKNAQVPRASTHFSSYTQACPLCKEQHRLFKCPKFIKLDVDNKFKFVTSNQLCNNCLSKGHSTKTCTSKFSCQRCGRRHHSLLHRNNAIPRVTTQFKPREQQSEAQPCNSPSTSNNSIHTLHAKNHHTKQALLATALLNVPTKKGTMLVLRALIDSGSQVSFVTQAAARKLQSSTTNVEIQITGLGKTETTNVQKQTTLNIYPHSTTTKATTVTALIVDTITDILPPSTIPNKEWSHIHELPLADPFFFKPGKIDLLLGADVYSEILLEGLRKGPPGTPTAQNSTLGWILFGKLKNTSTFSTASALTAKAHYDDDTSLDKLLRQFWETEEVNPGRKLSKADQECEEFYQKTHVRNAHGRYEVRLPFTTESPSLGDSRGMALRRFYSLERQLERNPELYQEYKACINEYKTLGHMTVANKIVSNEQSYYLPHHAVIKDSTTTKVRVVFDASAKTTNGKSLNEQLHTGPVLQSELFSIILRWRKYKFAMSADIEKMYRMIKVQPPDQNYQRIVSRNNQNETIQDYQLTTVTFGTTPAPYLAIKTLNQLAIDEADKFPEAAKIVSRDFYVDDLLTGSDTKEEAFKIQDQLINLLSSGGFNLRKWVSNSSDLLSRIPEPYREVELPLRFASDECVKTLGIHWFPGSYCFTLQYKRKSDCLSTKRSILSEIATLFDPLGWISPIIISAKILMQALWLVGCSWDEPILAPIDKQWHEFKSKLHRISSINIPCWSNTTSKLSITPGHFLIGTSLLLPPEPVLENKVSSLTRWKHLHKWHKWSHDYLNSLQNRPKWQTPISNPKIGDLVIIKEPNLVASRWLLGRIIEVHPGADNYIRIVSIKTKNGLVKRPVSKICILPIQEGSNCDKVLYSTKAKNGTIQTPLFPGPYPVRTFCRYEFQGQGRERVQIKFFEFSLPSDGDSYDCEEADILTVFIPVRGRFEPIETLCGDTMPKPIMSNGPRLLLEFRGRQSGKGNRGFKAEYKFLENFGIISGKQLPDSECSFVYNSSEARGGWFHSPNFPGAYPRNVECNYYFYGELNDRIFIRFTYFDVEGIFPCEEVTASDYVEFSNFMSIDRKFRKLCGKMDGFTVRSDGRFFRITFRTNDRFDKTGFRASYSFEAESPTTESNTYAQEQSSGNRKASVHLAVVAVGIFTHFYRAVKEIL